MTDRGPIRRLNPLEKAQSFIFLPHPRRQLRSYERRLGQVEKVAQAAGAVAVSAAVSGASGESAAFYDTLPDPTSEDLGSVIYVHGAAGQPSRGYQGVLSQNDTVVWEPVFTQAFYGAATEFLDDLIGYANWVVAHTGAGTDVEIAGGGGHPGVLRLTTGAVSGNQSDAGLDAQLALDDIDKFAIIVMTPATTTNIGMRFGLIPVGTGGTAEGIYIEKDNSETTWKFVKNHGDVETRTNTALLGNVANNWWLFQVENKLGGAFDLTLIDLTGSQGQETLSISGMTTSRTSRPKIFVTTTANAARQFFLDFVWIRFLATVRA